MADSDSRWHEQLLVWCREDISSSGALPSHADYLAKLKTAGFDVTHAQVSNRIRNFLKKGTLLKQTPAKNPANEGGGVGADGEGGEGGGKKHKHLSSGDTVVTPWNHATPRFSEEFAVSSEGKGCDRRVLAALQTGYECSVNHLAGSMAEFSMNVPDSTFSMMRMGVAQKRFCSGARYAVERLERRPALKPGDIIGFTNLSKKRQAAESVSFNTHFYSNDLHRFVNSPPCPGWLADPTGSSSQMRLFFGTTHLAVGFADLSLLATAKIEGSFEKDGPLVFHGVDQSEYAVARAFLIKHMLLDPDISAGQILEVWYSATWSDQVWTEAARDRFASAIRTAYEEVENSLRDNAGILMHLLETWLESIRKSTVVSVARARKEWFDTSGMRSDPDCTTFEIGSLLDEQDRIAACKYSATGDLHASPAGRPQCGNITFWEQVAESVRRPGSDNVNTVFDVLPVERVVAAKQKYRGSTGGAGTARPNIVDAIRSCLLADVVKLKNLVMTKQVCVHPLVETARATDDSDDEGEGAGEDSNFVKLACCLAPRTVSWSNIVDYMYTPDLHRMAAAISKGSTEPVVHYAYSMNYYRDVHGFNLYDYDRARDRRAILDEIRSPIKKIGEVSKSSLLRPMLESDLRHLSVVPPNTSVHNVVEYCMARRYGPKYVDWFLGKAKCEAVGGPGFVTKTGHGSSGGYGAPVYFAWKYTSAES
eukprot:g3772.t1